MSVARRPCGRRARSGSARPTSRSLPSQPAVVALLCRTSDRIPGGAAARRWPPARRALGTPPGWSARPARSARRAGRTTCATRAAACSRPAARSRTRSRPGASRSCCASDCSICMTTLPAVARAAPRRAGAVARRARRLQHPETTPSGFLGGMCLAGACGAWDAGFGRPASIPRASSCAACATSTPASACCRDARRRARRAPVAAGRAPRGPRGLRPPRPRRPRPGRAAGHRVPRAGRDELEGLAPRAGGRRRRGDVAGFEVTSFTAPEHARASPRCWRRCRRPQREGAGA